MGLPYLKFQKCLELCFLKTFFRHTSIFVDFFILQSTIPLGPKVHGICVLVYFVGEDPIVLLCLSSAKRGRCCVVKLLLCLTSVFSVRGDLT